MRLFDYLCSILFLISAPHPSVLLAKTFLCLVTNMSRNVLLTLRKEQSYSRARVLNKIVCMADKVPVYSVLNTVFVISRKRSIMRRAFVIFLAISFLAFSLDGRFVYFRLSLGCCSRWEQRRLTFPRSGW